ncbi:MAG: SH3 domain-containing protein [Lachnospiraceae bacterium]|nr:SH3 domain-containing protein [Lachnospiraceae bacterium]
MKGYQITTLCLAGMICFGVSSIKTEAASNLGVDSGGIASLLNEAHDGTPETSEEIAKILSPSEYEGICIAQVDNYVNVRSLPSEEGEVLGKLYDESAGTIEEEADGWYKITSGNVTGYVKGDYVVTGSEAEALAEEVGQRVATVTTETLRVRDDASLDASILGLIPQEEELTVLEEADGWVKVSIEEGDGWVSTDYVDLRTDFVQAESKAEEEARLEEERQAREEAARRNAEVSRKTGNSESPVVGNGGGSAGGNAVVAFASQFVGNPYVYGGTSLTNGADCSGFVMSVYANFGVGLPHSSSAMRGVGYGVSLSEAQPGDIICYSGHVAIYCGNNTIVHASTAATGIKYTSPVNYKNVLAVRRVF